MDANYGHQPDDLGLYATEPRRGVLTIWYEDPFGRVDYPVSVEPGYWSELPLSSLPGRSRSG